ncbi:MAG: response regulator [Clostridia bacterium]|nr:response regulator [Clostridia bacterium]
MYKVMAVDDEIWVLRGLKKLIPWERYGFELDRTFTDPFEALESFARQAPDVVFADISMARMDGFTLIQKMQRLRENVQFVIISAYSEFDYAKKAISFQVVDYLVKPITEDMLVAMLEKLSARLEVAGASSQRSKLYRWLIQPESVITAERLRWLTGIDWSPDMELVMLARLNGEVGQPPRAVASYAFPSADGTCSFRILAGSRALLEQCMVDVERDAIARGEIVGSSQSFSHVEDCRLALRQAWYGAHHAFFGDACGVFRADVAESDEMEMIVNLVREQAWRSAAHALKKLSDSPPANGSIGGAFHLYQQVTALLNISKPRLQSIDSVEELLSTFRRFSDMCIAMGAAMLENAEGGALEMIAVETYLQRHFRQPELSVQSIAAVFGVDADYLGRRYREEMDRSIRQSIQEKRLNYAAKLLQETDAPVQEIARLCGYVDPFYFNKVFKKVYNATPMQYKKKQKIQ